VRKAGFHFDGNGDVQGEDADARNTSEILKLDHRTLAGWRKEAIGVFTDPDVFTSNADLDAIIAAMDAPAAGKLPAY
jgi:hypothetical protein